MEQHIVLHQRLASGYIPGLSETFAQGASPVSAVLQNCTVVRPVGAGLGTGVYDIIIGGVNAAAPVGLGAPLVGAPPLKAALAPGENVTNQGRTRLQHRSALAIPIAAAKLAVFPTIAYGPQFLTAATNPYAGTTIQQIVRVFYATVDAAAAQVLADADFDFDIERVIDPNVEP